MNDIQLRHDLQDVIFLFFGIILYFLTSAPGHVFAVFTILLDFEFRKRKLYISEVNIPCEIDNNILE